MGPKTTGFVLRIPHTTLDASGCLSDPKGLLVGDLRYVKTSGVLCHAGCSLISKLVLAKR